MTRLHEIQALGQSIWLDNIRRALLTSGELQLLLDAGVTGVTSNPSIFERAIAGSADYDDAIVALTAQGLSSSEIAEALMIDDIRAAADLLRPTFDRTAGVDGYVSLEVEPTLAHDAEGTVAAAVRLHGILERPNVMIKVPATPDGIRATEALTALGISINITLIFDAPTYEQVAGAYIRGLRTFVAQGGDPATVASVASVFVSRVDSAVDAALAEREIGSWQGRTAIANAKGIYGRFQSLFAGDDWSALAARGGRVQRVLWASTGTKNPAYADTKYVDGLIGADTVNTVPPATLAFVLDHGQVAATVASGVEASRTALAGLADVGIDLAAITQQLQHEAIAAFLESFHALNRSIEAKQRRLAEGSVRATFQIGPFQQVVEEAIAELREQKIMARIWRHDHTVWSPAPDEITNRLGWLQAPEQMLEHVGSLQAFVADIWRAGYRRVVLLGMGGSSLAPEVFERTFGNTTAPAALRLPLSIIDTTDPGAIHDRTSHLDLATTLFIVATKSGSTVETLSAFKFCYNRVAQAVGVDQAGDHFIAITDPGSALEALAASHGFRRTFLADPNIGGRYAALSLFGLVPASLVGVDVKQLLGRAGTAACNADAVNCPSAGDNLAARLGVTIGELAKAGRDKLTFVTSASLASFGDWVEQLIAESTGKQGKGIVPVVDEPLGAPGVYGDDRVFVHLALRDDHADDAALRQLGEAGHPVISVRLDDAYDLGGQFFLWEMSTAVAATRLGIHPFNQPDVESAKVLARRMVASYHTTGSLEGDDGITPSLASLSAFLEQVQPGDYVAIQAYLNPTAAAAEALRRLRVRIRDARGVATTLGFGPRFLHSTGQLHKGDAGRGHFLQLVAPNAREVAIPDEVGSDISHMTFGILLRAQAIGDALALEQAGRHIVRFALGDDVVGDLTALARGVA